MARWVPLQRSMHIRTQRRVYDEPDPACAKSWRGRSLAMCACQRTVAERSARMTPLLHAKGLTKVFRRLGSASRRADDVPAVRDVELTVSSGETVAVVGESGAGKSTLGRLVMRLIEPDEGSIVFEGIELRDLSRRRLR